MYNSILTVMDDRKEAYYTTQTVPAQLSVRVLYQALGSVCSPAL